MENFSAKASGSSLLEVPNQPSESKFEIIFGRLRNEISQIRELSYGIKDKVDTISRNDDPVRSGSKNEVAPSCSMIDEFHTKLDELSELRRTLEDVFHNLKSIV